MSNFAIACIGGSARAANSRKIGVFSDRGFAATFVCFDRVSCGGVFVTSELSLVFEVGAE
jgi:hypothetical protein